ncbi:Zn-dependent hydrolase [Ureibacillus composti]|nr:Zn-dependent hydrolase [Ureibacillus composti]
MKQLKQNSTEMYTVLKNLELENLTLSPSLQQKAIDIVNSGKKITSSIIKGALNHEKL